MEIALLILNTALLLGLAAVVFFRKQTPGGLDALEKKLNDNFADIRRETREINTENRQETGSLFSNLQDTLLKRITENIQLQKTQYDDFALRTKNDAQTNRQALTDDLKVFGEQLRENFTAMNERQDAFNRRLEVRIGEIKEEVEKQLNAIRKDNSDQLNDMRKTVDEKLQTTLEKRLSESFKQVSERLEQVHKGLGDMQTLAAGVGDLKKVLSNVKTRGTLGEYQLENILEQILSPQQYEKNVAPKKGSLAKVEFAVKLPGSQDNETVFLPIDSKFPLAGYEVLLDAYDAGDVEKIAIARKQLLSTVDSFAKDISQKYISPPDTTDFALLFLPVEGLYAEILRDPAMFENLQNKYKIAITGPTTLSAFLNSLNMGFRTLAVQKRSSEVWKVLADVKVQFGKFTDTLSAAKKQVDTAAKTLDTLQTTRLSQMQRKLKDVETLDGSDLLEASADEEIIPPLN